jgi:hypothetical protein
MQAEASRPIERYRREVRAGLVALGLPLAGIGAWALVAPRSWFDEFPGGGMSWVSALPPFNEHLVRDFGSLYLGLGLLVLWSALLLERRLVQAACGVLLVFSVPHFIYHLTELDALPTGENVANMTTLGLSVVVPVVLLVLVRPGGTLVTPARGTRSETSIEGGVSYGTR